MRKRWFCGAALFAARWLMAAEGKESGLLSEFWGAIYLGDQKIGHTHQAFARDGEATGDGSRSEWSTRLAFRRGEAMLEFEESALVVEDADGKVRRYRHAVESYSGGVCMTATRVDGTVQGGVVRLVSNGYEREFPLAPEARGPWFVHQRLLRERDQPAGHRCEVVVFSPELGGAMRVQVEYGPWEQVSVRGVQLRLQRLTQTMEIRPLHPDVEWLDEAGVAQLAQVDIPMLGKVDVIQGSKADALLPANPVELMAAAALPSPQRIAWPRGTRQASYTIAHSPGGRVLETETQKVKQLAEDLVEVTVGTPPAEAQIAGYQGPYPHPERVQEFLRPTAFLESDQPLIRDMAREAAAGVSDSVQLARRLEQFVRSRIHSKTLDMGFASALETAKALRGDCSEHGVLVAALARALGIPSRLVVGLAYVGDGVLGAQHPNGSFVFHVWAELLAAPDVWLPVDAALGNYDATHIALTRSALASASPLVDLCLPVLELVDRLSLRSVTILDPRPAPASAP